MGHFYPSAISLSLNGCIRLFALSIIIDMAYTCMLNFLSCCFFFIVFGSLPFVFFFLTASGLLIEFHFDSFIVFLIIHIKYFSDCSSYYNHVSNLLQFTDACILLVWATCKTFLHISSPYLTCLKYSHYMHWELHQMAL